MRAAKNQPQYYMYYHDMSRSLATAVDKTSLEDFYESLSPPRKKFHGILNEYKRANFEKDIPSRFFKKILDAVDANQDGVITMEELQTLLKNIGAKDKMSEQELGEIFDELGVDNGEKEKVIPVKNVEVAWSPYLYAMGARG